MSSWPGAACGKEWEPIFFGPGKSLYGCYHPPRSAEDRNAAVVVCCPVGDEYVRAHRACRQLAIQCAEAGYHTLRFDYHGCGDSDGDDEDGCLTRWVVDIRTAVRAIRQLGGVWDVNLVGWRLGASLAGLAAAEGNDIQRLVLWDPVITGAVYAQELVARHRRRLQFLPAGFDDEQGEHGFPAECLGFGRSAAFARELQSFHLQTATFSPSMKLLIVEQKRRGLPSWSRGLQATHPAVSVQWSEDPDLFECETDKLLVPSRTIRSLVAWLSEVPHE